MPDTHTDCTTILAGIAALIEQAERHAVTPRDEDRAKAISRREELQDLKRRVERGGIGDLTRARAAEQAAFEQGWKMAREGCKAVADREVAETGNLTAAKIANAIRALPVPERGT